MFCNLNNLRTFAIGSDYDLEKYEIFICILFFSFSSQGRGFVFTQISNLTQKRVNSFFSSLSNAFT